jgi:DNA-3-methyladenine glycosylase
VRTRSRRRILLSADFFARSTKTVARDLLGARLVTTAGGRRTAGRIVEVEAYLGAVDPASHAFRFRRHRQNQSLYSPPGTWYVYLSYGVHWCVNLVAGTRNNGAAILIRALEPVEGIDLMAQRRGGMLGRTLCGGPGRLTQALGITRMFDGLRVDARGIRVERDQPVRSRDVVVTTRIGLTQAADWRCRYLIRGSPWVSRRATG